MMAQDFRFQRVLGTESAAGTTFEGTEDQRGRAQHNLEAVRETSIKNL